MSYEYLGGLGGLAMLEYDMEMRAALWRKHQEQAQAWAKLADGVVPPWKVPVPPKPEWPPRPTQASKAKPPAPPFKEKLDPVAPKHDSPAKDEVLVSAEKCFALAKEEKGDWWHRRALLWEVAVFDIKRFNEAFSGVMAC